MAYSLRPSRRDRSSLATGLAMLAIESTAPCVGARPPFELRWDRAPGTHQVGWFDRIKPTVGKREASATPEEFARELIRLAEWSRGA